MMTVTDAVFVCDALTKKRNKIITLKVREENRNEISVGNFWDSSYGRNYRNTNFNTFSC